MALTTMRWLEVSRRVTCFAFAKDFRDFGGIAIVIVECDVVGHLGEHKRCARF